MLFFCFFAIFYRVNANYVLVKQKHSFAEVNAEKKIRIQRTRTQIFARHQFYIYFLRSRVWIFPQRVLQMKETMASRINCRCFSFAGFLLFTQPLLSVLVLKRIIWLLKDKICFFSFRKIFLSVGYNIFFILGQSYKILRLKTTVFSKLNYSNSFIFIICQ